jgi:hypothetical protein
VIDWSEHAVGRDCNAHSNCDSIAGVQNAPRVDDGGLSDNDVTGASGGLDLDETVYNYVSFYNDG